MYSKLGFVIRVTVLMLVTLSKICAYSVHNYKYMHACALDHNVYLIYLHYSFASSNILKVKYHSLVKFWKHNIMLVKIYVKNASKTRLN